MRSVGLVSYFLHRNYALSQNSWDFKMDAVSPESHAINISTKLWMFLQKSNPGHGLESKMCLEIFLYYYFWGSWHIFPHANHLKWVISRRKPCNMFPLPNVIISRQNCSNFSVQKNGPGPLRKYNSCLQEFSLPSTSQMCFSNYFNNSIISYIHF